jgi:hypothetical protein
MAEVFDVKVSNIMVPGTSAADLCYPLFHVPASGGAITILEAQVTCATASNLGSADLWYGTLDGADGTIVPAVALATSVGTGGGTFPALAPFGLTKVLTPCVVPANKWVGIIIGTAADAGQNWVTIAYVNGRQVA